MENIAAKTHQILSLCVYIQSNSKNTASLVLNGVQDTFVVKVVDSNDKKVLYTKIEKFSKKNETLISKELEKVANSLLEIKEKIDNPKSLESTDIFTNNNKRKPTIFRCGMDFVTFLVNKNNCITFVK